MKPRGIYILRHRPTGKLYVGASKDLDQRRKTWWVMLSASRANLPVPFRGMPPFVRSDWEFHVASVVIPVTMRALRAAEQRTIDLIKTRAPERLLNTLTRMDATHYEHMLTCGGRTLSVRSWARQTGIKHQTIHYRLSAGWPMDQVLGFAPRPETVMRHKHKAMVLRNSLVLIKDGDETLSQSQAATRLECLVKTLALRLKKYRVPGKQAVVQFSQLRQLSEKFRA